MGETSVDNIELEALVSEPDAARSHQVGSTGQIPGSVRILGAVTPTNKTNSSLLNLDYPVLAVLALSVWNLVQ